METGFDNEKIESYNPNNKPETTGALKREYCVVVCRV
jgi:hypothetical protein